eukprot:284817814_3
MSISGLSPGKYMVETSLDGKEFTTMVDWNKTTEAEGTTTQSKSLLQRSFRPTSSFPNPSNCALFASVCKSRWPQFCCICRRPVHDSFGINFAALIADGEALVVTIFILTFHIIIQLLVSGITSPAGEMCLQVESGNNFAGYVTPHVSSARTFRPPAFMYSMQECNLIYPSLVIYGNTRILMTKSTPEYKIPISWDSHSCLLADVSVFANSRASLAEQHLSNLVLQWLLGMGGSCFASMRMAKSYRKYRSYVFNKTTCECPKLFEAFPHSVSSQRDQGWPDSPWRLQALCQSRRPVSMGSYVGVRLPHSILSMIQPAKIASGRRLVFISIGVSWECSDAGETRAETSSRLPENGENGFSSWRCGSLALGMKVCIGISANCLPTLPKYLLDSRCIRVLLTLSQHSVSKRLLLLGGRWKSEDILGVSRLLPRRNARCCELVGSWRRLQTTESWYLTYAIYKEITQRLIGLTLLPAMRYWYLWVGSSEKSADMKNYTSVSLTL